MSLPGGRIGAAFATVAEFEDPMQPAVKASWPPGIVAVEDRDRWPEYAVSRIGSALSAYKAQSLSPVERIQRLVERSDRQEEGSTLAFLDRDLLNRAAVESEHRWREGAVRPLEGITVGVKDIVDVAGLPTALGLNRINPNPAKRDSAIVARLRRDGAIPFVKLRTYEYAWAEDSGINPVINPVDPRLITGGSSNGSAAAVGFGLVDIAIGSDTLGSTRAPAAFCGVVGLKLSQGAVPTTGMAGLAPSLDCLGLLGASVHDVTHVWDSLTDGPRRAPVSSPKAAIITAGPRSDGVINALKRAGSVLEDRGWSVDQCPFNRLDDAAAAGLVIVAVESSRQGWATPPSSGLSAGVEELLEAGRHASRGVYEAAMNFRRSLSIEMSAIFATYDVILSPVTPGSAPGVESLYFTIRGEQIPWLDIANTHLAWSNLGGFPSLSVPVRLETDGSVTSLQVTSRMFAEEVALSVGSILEWSL